MMGKYCGDSIPPNHVSSSNSILIHFFSDAGATETGFKMEYNPTGKQNTSIQNNTEYYEDYYRDIWGYPALSYTANIYIFLQEVEVVVEEQQHLSELQLAEAAIRAGLVMGIVMM